LPFGFELNESVHIWIQILKGRFEERVGHQGISCNHLMVFDIMATGHHCGALTF
jgi:hypothetical protein